MKRHTYRAEIAYDGSAFAGFCRQPGLRTVESTLVEALQPFIPELRGVAVGGRTDRGVDAAAQVISFWSRPALELVALHEAIGGVAPGALSLLSLREVPRSFHARPSSRSR